MYVTSHQSTGQSGPCAVSLPQTRLAIVVTGEPIERARLRRGGFFALIRDALGRAEGLVELDAQRELPPLSEFSAVIVSGSPASVMDEAPWMSALAANLLRAMDSRVPVLGVCFGHQILASALGGRVERNPLGREIGTVRLEKVAEDRLLDVPYDPLLVNMTHLDSVLELPEGARVLARTDLDPNAVVRFSERAWGVQFHPEIDMEVMLDYVDGRAEAIRSEGLDFERIRGGIGETPGGRCVLSKFLEIAAVR
jgi:GMP synthase (glutamine-hydrolysing)